MKPNCTLLLLTMMLIPAVTTAQTNREVYEYELDANVEVVWQAFTTSEGLTQWMAPLADIELKVGGKMRSNYNPEGKLGDATTIENTILSFDPQRMLSLKATKYPKGFPFEKAAKPTWSIFYFSKLDSTRTKVTVVGLGYMDDEESKKMRSFFKFANKQVLDKLAAALANDKSDQSSSEPTVSLPEIKAYEPPVEDKSFILTVVPADGDVFGFAVYLGKEITPATRLDAASKGALIKQIASRIENGMTENPSLDTILLNCHGKVRTGDVELIKSAFRDLKLKSTPKIYVGILEDELAADGK